MSAHAGHRGTKDIVCDQAWINLKGKNMNNKSKFFRMRITTQFPGRYAEQTVYSILVKAIRNKTGLTKKTIAERTGLDRGETVTKACAWLVEDRTGRTQERSDMGEGASHANMVSLEESSKARLVGPASICF